MKTSIIITSLRRTLAALLVAGASTFACLHADANAAADFSKARATIDALEREVAVATAASTEPHDRAQALLNARKLVSEADRAMRQSRLSIRNESADGTVGAEEGRALASFQEDLEERFKKAVEALPAPPNQPTGDESAAAEPAPEPEETFVFDPDEIDAKVALREAREFLEEAKLAAQADEEAFGYYTAGNTLARELKKLGLETGVGHFGQHVWMQLKDTYALGSHLVGALERYVQRLKEHSETLDLGYHAYLREYRAGWADLRRTFLDLAEEIVKQEIGTMRHKYGTPEYAEAERRLREAAAAVRAPEVLRLPLSPEDWAKESR